MRHLLAGEDLRQLFRAAGGILGWDHPQRDAMFMAQDRAQHRDSLRFVIFNADQHFTRFEDPRQNTNTFNNLRRTLLHQAVIRRDVRFAFSGIDNQRLDFIAAALELNPGWEACAAQPGDAELMNTLNQRFTRTLGVIVPALTFNPAIFTVRFNNDAQFRQGGRMGRAVRRNSHHGAGGRCMNR